MIQEQLTEVLKERIRNADELQNNWGDGLEQCWKKETAILTADVSKSIDYFLHECTDEEFFWLAEVFEWVAKQTQSMEFVDALRIRLKQVTPESYHQQDFESDFMRKYVDYNEYVSSIAEEIDYADGQLEY